MCGKTSRATKTGRDTYRAAVNRLGFGSAIAQEATVASHAIVQRPCCYHMRRFAAHVCDLLDRLQ